MLIFRRFLPLVISLSLLVVQQGGATHALRHALSNVVSEQQQHQDKQSAHPHACEKCATFAQLGNAPIIPVHVFILVATSSEVIQHHAIYLHFVYVPSAVARGPPAVGLNLSKNPLHFS